MKNIETEHASTLKINEVIYTYSTRSLSLP